MGEKLKPCPFCGNEHPEIVSGDGVQCEQCWASAPYDSWNRRTPGPATAKLIRCIKADLEPSDKMLDAFLAEHEPAKDDRKDDCAAAPDANPRT